MSRRVIHWTAEDFDAAMEGAAPPTDDDVWIDRDGTRIDTPEKAYALAEREMERRREQAAAAEDASTPPSAE